MNSLIVRNLQVADLSTVERLHVANSDFPVPDLCNNLYCCNKIVEDSSGNPIGIGFVRLTSETIIILDKTQPKTLRCRAVKSLGDALKHDVKELGMDETHAFINDSDCSLREILKRMFGFIECTARSIYLQF
jgi:hypothetical protein